MLYILKDIFPLIKNTCKNKNSCILFDLSNISCIFVAILRSQAKYSEYDKKLLGEELLVDKRQTGTELCNKGFGFRACCGDA